MFSSMKGSFCLFLLLSSAVQAQVESPSHNYNVTLPEPNTPYVAGQMLPISYTLPNDANLSKQLSLSVYFTTKDAALNFTETMITSNADLSQGFSFKRGKGSDVVYEHQLSYAIPNNTAAGEYQVVFLDAYTRFNTTIPISVRPYADAAATPSSSINKARPSGSIFAQGNDGTLLLPKWHLFIIPFIYSFIIIIY